MVFYDRFETVFSDGQSSEEIDKVFDGLFAGNHGCYVKEEYTTYSALAYEPPPIYGVRMSEPEKRDCLDILKRKHHTTERRQELEPEEM